MFSLHMPDREQEPVRKRGRESAFGGMVLGFAAGLTVVIALDALVLNHALFRDLPHWDWYMPQVVRSAVALPWR